MNSITEIVRAFHAMYGSLRAATLAYSSHHSIPTSVEALLGIDVIYKKDNCEVEVDDEVIAVFV